MNGRPINKVTAAFSIFLIITSTVLLTKVYDGFYGDFSVWNYIGPLVPMLMGVGQLMQDAE